MLNVINWAFSLFTFLWWPCNCLNNGLSSYKCSSMCSMWQFNTQTDICVKLNTKRTKACSFYGPRALAILTGNHLLQISYLTGQHCKQSRFVVRSDNRLSYCFLSFRMIATIFRLLYAYLISIYTLILKLLSLCKPVFYIQILLELDWRQKFILITTHKNICHSISKLLFVEWLIFEIYVY